MGAGAYDIARACMHAEENAGPKKALETTTCDFGQLAGPREPKVNFLSSSWKVSS